MDQFKFISSEIIVAQIKQELKSYFDSGSMNEVLIPSHINDALRKLNLLVLELDYEVIEVDNYRGYFDKKFTYIKDAWLCEVKEYETYEHNPNIYKYYKKTICDSECNNVNEVFENIVKVTPTKTITYEKPSLLKISNTSLSKCSKDCKGINQINTKEIKINDRYISTNFNSGNVYIEHYSRPYDEFGPLIPEIVEVEEFIKYFVIFKLFEQLWNSVSDESTNIIERKLRYYKETYFAKYESALNILKTESKQQFRDSVNKMNGRFLKYIIS